MKKPKPRRPARVKVRREAFDWKWAERVLACDCSSHPHQVCDKCQLLSAFKRMGPVKVRRCTDPQCRNQLEIALDTILRSRAEEDTANKALYRYLKSYEAHQATLRDLVNLAIHDVGGRIYFRAEEAKKLMELAR